MKDCTLLKYYRPVILSIQYVTETQLDCEIDTDELPFRAFFPLCFCLILTLDITFI